MLREPSDNGWLFEVYRQEVLSVVIRQASQLRLSFFEVSQCHGLSISTSLPCSHSFIHVVVVLHAGQNLFKMCNNTCSLISSWQNKPCTQEMEKLLSDRLKVVLPRKFGQSANILGLLGHQICRWLKDGVELWGFGWQTKDISDFGSLKEVAGIFVPGTVLPSTPVIFISRDLHIWLEIIGKDAPCTRMFSLFNVWPFRAQFHVYQLVCWISWSFIWIAHRTLHTSGHQGKGSVFFIEYCLVLQLYSNGFSGLN